MLLFHLGSRKFETITHIILRLRWQEEKKCSFPKHKSLQSTYLLKQIFFPDLIFIRWVELRYTFVEMKSGTKIGETVIFLGRKQPDRVPKIPTVHWWRSMLAASLEMSGNSVKAARLVNKKRGRRHSREIKYYWGKNFVKVRFWSTCVRQDFLEAFFPIYHLSLFSNPTYIFPRALLIANR